ncbi:unnamed protein product [Rotaria sp. Silwood1]|nr:unnamed protein product [Rotaria sp. Silwood1]
MINRALQTQDIKVIVKMRLFIQDFHRQLEQIKINDKISTISYRSQNLSNDDFQKKMKTSQDNLLSFNNFMLADTNYETALDGARHERINNNAVGILFRIEVESTQASIPFVSLTNLSYLAEQGKYVLFSMHSVFRILEVKQIEDHLWQVNLKLTEINDKQMACLDKLIREETQDVAGWYKLSKIIIILCDFDHAKEIYFILLNLLLENVSSKISHIYNELGLICDEMSDYASVLSFYKKAIEIRHKSLPPNHHFLSTTYNNIGELQMEIDNFPVALKYFEKVLQIRLKTCSPYNSSLAITYNNIGLIHREMGDYSQAISFFQKSLGTKQKTFTSYHSSLAITYNNIGEINQLMGEFSQALMSYQKPLEIQEKTFSLNHSELATTYDNIGITHQSIENYSIALSFYQKALKTRQKSLSASHPSVSTSYNNIEHLYQSMGDYNITLEYYQKTQNFKRNL